MDKNALLGIILSSSLVATALSSLKDLIIWKFNRKDQKEEKADSTKSRLEKAEESLGEVSGHLADHLKESSELFQAIKSSNRLLMRERIRTLATSFLREDEITYEDRKLLHDMWYVYHNVLGGNGDLDLIMQEIDELSLKLK